MQTSRDNYDKKMLKAIENISSELTNIRKMTCDSHTNMLVRPEKGCVCSSCGQVMVDLIDIQEGVVYSEYKGYGSNYDGEQIQKQFCCTCWDKVIKFMENLNANVKDDTQELEDIKNGTSEWIKSHDAHVRTEAFNEIINKMEGK